MASIAPDAVSLSESRFKQSADTPMRSQRPRTRSSVLKAGQTSGANLKIGLRRRKSKDLKMREASPVIDLTEDAVIEEESPSKRPSGKRVRPARKNFKGSIETARLVENISHSGSDRSTTQILGEGRISEVTAASEKQAPKLDFGKLAQPIPEVSLDLSSDATSSAKSSELSKEHTISKLSKNPDRLLPVQSPMTTAYPTLSPPRRSMELNLSPIKSRASQAPSPKTARHNPTLLSSPFKKRKYVMFSDSIAQEVPSSPLSQHDRHPATTPMKSILKSAANNENSSPMDPNNTALWVKTAHSILHHFSTEYSSPNNPSFWTPGTIIQLEHRSNDLPQLMDGCMEVLSNVDFPRKFEVYATLNLICKLNDFGTVGELFTGQTSGWLQQVEKNCGYKSKSLRNAYLQDICRFVRRDMDIIESQLFSTKDHPKLSPSKIDPFQSRTLNQALKVIGHLLAIPTVNVLFPASDVKWFYSHTCDIIIQPTLSKSLVLPYLSIIKDCHFPPKKRKALFESSPTPILESILFALLNMKNFLSSSLINEKFIAMKNLIQNFPAVMAKNFHHWFPGLILNLCDVSFVLYPKVSSASITTLLEAARNFLDSNDVCLAARNILESPLRNEPKSCMTENLLSMASPPQDVMIDYVIDSLKDLIENGQFKHAMDIWVGITLFLGNFDNGIENWPHLNSWLNVHRSCFNDKSIHAKETALSSWKVVVYRICCNELRDLRLSVPGAVDGVGALNFSPNAKQLTHFDDIFKPKIKLLIHPFVNTTHSDLDRKVVEVFHHLFLSILYNLLNYQPKTFVRYLPIFWDRIIQPVMFNFYFKKDASNAHMHHLGLGIMNRLLKPSAPLNEKSYSSIRCLSNETISLSDVNSLNPRWVWLRFEKILPLIVLICKLDKLEIEAKLSCILSFLSSLKFTTKKEVQVSYSTYDIIDNFPTIIEKFSNFSNISYEALFKFIVQLNDTFGVSHLVSEWDDQQAELKSIYEVILMKTLHMLNSHQLNAILSMLYGQIGEKKSLHFLHMLVQINKAFKREDLMMFVGDCLQTKKSMKFSQPDMIILGQIFETLDRNFSGIAKKLIQHIVLLKAEDFESKVTQLNLSKWNIQIFKFFVTLMHDAPFEHLKQTNLKLIKERLANEEDFADLLGLLVENKFDFEIFSLKETLIPKLMACQLNDQAGITDAWRSYLKEFNGEYRMLDLLLLSLMEAGFAISGVIQDRWGDLPATKAFWLKQHGSLPVSQDFSENARAVNLTTSQSELESMLALEVQNNDNTLRKDLDLNEEQHNIHHRRESFSLRDSAFGSRLIESCQPAKSINVAMVTRSKAIHEDQSPTVIELSSEDYPKLACKSDATENNTNEDKPAKSISNVSKVDNPDIIEDSDPNHGSLNSSGNRKRRNDEDDDSSRKLMRIGTKEVSDSEETMESRERQEVNSEHLEINSSSEEQGLLPTNLTLANQHVVLEHLKTAAVSSSIEHLVECLDRSPKEALSMVEDFSRLEGETFLSQLQTLILNINETELEALSADDRYQLETMMLNFMVRMRGTPGR